MPVKELKKYLDDNHIKYVSVKHSKAYTAQEIAASAHIPGKEIAKTVMIMVDNKMAMAVIPASYVVDFDLLKEAADAENIILANENEFTNLFSDCDVGAMPPFGNLYGMPVFVCQSLAEDDHISFNAGSHTELIQLSYRDFESLVKPKVAKISIKS